MFLDESRSLPTTAAVMAVEAAPNTLTWAVVIAVALLAVLAGLAMLILRPRERDSAERVGVRAQITVESADIAFDRSAGGFRPAVSISNIGYLPAKRLVVEAGAQFSATREFALPRDFPDQQSLDVIGPGETRLWSSSQAIVGEPQDWLFVYGRVRYADGLGARRTTEFCFRYVAGRKLPGATDVLLGKTATPHKLDNTAL